MVVVVPSGALSSDNEQAALWPVWKYIAVGHKPLKKEEYIVGTYRLQNLIISDVIKEKEMPG